MTKVLLINGHEYWEISPGKLNEFLMTEAQSYFEQIGFSIKETRINNSYDITEEVEKYLWADHIIYFTPVYWFDIPSGFKAYIEKVFSGGKKQLFIDDGRSNGGKYGTGGLLNSTNYMLITTWNAPEEAFNNAVSSPLFKNKSVDDVFLNFHSAQKFIGMNNMPGIHFHDVKKKPDFDQFKNDLLNHLKSNFNC